MTADQDRRLPNHRLRALMLGMEQVMGGMGLNLILRQSGLERFAGDLPPEDNQISVLASEYAALNKTIEDYFGRGARTSLIRIGRAAYRHKLQSPSLRARLDRRVLRWQSAERRKLRALEELAMYLAEPDGDVSAHQEERKLVFVAGTSDAAFGRKSDLEICWLTVGEIQEALRQATSHEYEVVEVACKATGAPACRFEIGEVIGD